jgi:hypothetical protein
MDIFTNSFPLLVNGAVIFLVYCIKAELGNTGVGKSGNGINVFILNHYLSNHHPRQN